MLVGKKNGDDGLIINHLSQKRRKNIADLERIRGQLFFT